MSPFDFRTGLISGYLARTRNFLELRNQVGVVWRSIPTESETPASTLFFLKDGFMLVQSRSWAGSQIFGEVTLLAEAERSLALGEFAAISIKGDRTAEVIFIGTKDWVQ